jgi:hypothetical protein
MKRKRDLIITRKGPMIRETTGMGTMLRWITTRCSRISRLATISLIWSHSESFLFS